MVLLRKTWLKQNHWDENGELMIIYSDAVIGNDNDDYDDDDEDNYSNADNSDDDNCINKMEVKLSAIVDVKYISVFLHILFISL